MIDTAKIIEKSKDSVFYLKLLNWGLYRLIPFNKPHGFKIIEISDRHIKVAMPYKRSNLNHIKGLHACGLATISEFSTGLLLLSKLDRQKYRMILQRIEVDYLYQGKIDAIAQYSIPDDNWVKNEIINPLQEKDSVSIPCTVKTYDVRGNHLTDAIVYWQFKEWRKVNTKL